MVGANSNVLGAEVWRILWPVICLHLLDGLRMPFITLRACIAFTRQASTLVYGKCLQFGHALFFTVGLNYSEEPLCCAMMKAHLGA